MRRGTQDGGVTWNTTFAKFTFCSGGTLANGGDFERASTLGDVLAERRGLPDLIAFNGLDLTNAVTISRSPDGGATWSNPTALIRDSGGRDSSWAFNDKESITADPFDSNYVYAVLDRLVSPNNKSRASIQRSINSKTFRGPILFARTTHAARAGSGAHDRRSGDNQTIGNQIDVLADGTVVNLFTEIVAKKNAGGNRGVHFSVIRSGDHGATWGDSIVVATDSSKGVTDPETGEPLRTGDGFRTSQSIATPARRDTATSTSCGKGRAAVRSVDDTIYLARSTDGGSTSSAPKKVNQTPNGAAAFLPSVHVADNGAVGVTYYDLRNNHSGPSLPTDVWIVHSTMPALPSGHTRTSPARSTSRQPRWPAGTSSATTRARKCRQRVRTVLRSDQQRQYREPDRHLLHESCAVAPVPAGAGVMAAPASTTSTSTGSRRHSTRR